VERLERLAQQLAEDLDRKAELSTEDECVTPELLEQFLSGSIGAEARARVEAHLDRCLICLNRLVAFRDCFNGLTASAKASSRLAARLGGLIEPQTRPQFWSLVVETIRRLIALRIPAGWVVAATTAAILGTWMITSIYQRELPSPTSILPSVSGPRPMTPLSQRTDQGTRRTVSGVVMEVRDATFDGIEAHIVRLRDWAGVEYSMFVWGPVTVRERDSVQAEGVFQETTEVGGPVIHKGVAIMLKPIGPAR
jgi:hypothetical protein